MKKPLIGSPPLPMCGDHLHITKVSGSSSNLNEHDRRVFEVD